MDKPATSRIKRLQPLIALAAFLVAAWLIYRSLREFSIDEIRASIEAISFRHVALGGLFTLGSFICLSGYDLLAVRYTGSSLRYRRVAVASFTALSIGHVLGMAALSSGAIRYRFYTRWGLSRGDVGRIIVFCGVTVALGIAAAGGLAASARHELVAELFRVDSGLVAVIGAALLLTVAGYVGLAAAVHQPLRIRRFELPVPGVRLALGQVAVGTADFLMVAAVLHQMVSASADIGYLPIAAGYITANAAGIVTHVPGGLGVIEAIVLSLVPNAEVVGALIAFRALYYLVPFVLGCATLITAEAFHRRRRRPP